MSHYPYSRLASVTQYDANGGPLSQTTMAMTLRPPKTAADARNGTTTNYFNNADLLCGVSTPPPAANQNPQVTTNFFDGLGRVVASVLPDNTTISNL